MEKKIKLLNIRIKLLNVITIIFLTLYLLLFPLLNNFISIIFVYLPVNSTNILILLDYIPTLLLIVNVILIILMQTKIYKKENKIKLTKLNITILIIFVLSILLSTPFSNLSEVNNSKNEELFDEYGEEESHYGEQNTLHFSKFFVLREYYVDEEGNANDEISEQYIYIPLVKKLIIITNDFTIEDFNIETYNVKKKNNKIILYTKDEEGNINSTVYRK